MFVNEDRLADYRKKRNFGVTSEPAGSKTEADRRIFVVQKHEARSLHYDLRLEDDGVLKSWAVPKGPSMNPKDKRLAIETEDHPLEYASFEGVIPKGEYGAGAVIVWDTGPYRNLTEKDGREVPLAEALENGHASFRLDGKKLKGGFALTRTTRGWILIKMKDELADTAGDILETEPRSVLSNRTVHVIADGIGKSTAH